MMNIKVICAGCHSTMTFVRLVALVIYPSMDDPTPIGRYSCDACRTSVDVEMR